MSVKGIHWAQQVHGVGPFKKVILLNLGERHNIDSGLCTADQVMLARDCDMTDRTVRKYLKLLAEDGFIDRRVVKTSRGLQTHYILHFDRFEPQAVEGDRKDVPDTDRKDIPQGGSGMPVPEGSGMPVPEGSGTCVPVHIEHESTRRLHEDSCRISPKPDAVKPSARKKKRKTAAAVDDMLVLEAFERLWAVWPRRGKERSRSKSCVLDKLRAAAKRFAPAAIVDAAAAFVGKTEERYVPALDRWLAQGRYEHFIAGASLFSEPTKSNVEPIDWSAAFREWQKSGFWPRHLDCRPDEPGYRGPLAPLKDALAAAPPGHPVCRGLRANIARLEKSAA